MTSGLDPDIVLVGGIVLSIFFLPMVLTAIIERRRPYLSLFGSVVGIALLAYAYRTHPDGLTWQDVPTAFARAVAQIL